jgi:signal recognition particle receptor subunit beta
MFNDEHLQHKPFLILANKQDLPNRMNVDELRDKLNLNKLDGNTKWHLQPTSAIHNEGIYEGFKWLEDSLVEKIDPMKPIVETLNDVKTMKNYLTSIFNMDNFKTLLNKSI